MVILDNRELRRQEQSLQVRFQTRPVLRGSWSYRNVGQLVDRGIWDAEVTRSSRVIPIGNILNKFKVISIIVFLTKLYLGWTNKEYNLEKFNKKALNYIRSVLTSLKIVTDETRYLSREVQNAG